MRPRSTASVVALSLLPGLACSSDPRPAEWSYISPVIFQPNCATQSCHSRAAAVAGLDFSDPDRGYTSLTGLWIWIPNPTDNDKSTLSCGEAGGEHVCEQRFRPLVTPYDPNESRLVNMLRARGAARMPPDRPLNEADIRLVEQWILNGAKREPDLILDAAASASPDPGDAGGDGGAAPAGDGGARTDGGATDGPGDGGASPDATARPALSSTAPSWQPVSGVADVPAQAGSLFVRLTVTKPAGQTTAEALFDDVSLSKHGDAASLVKNGGFDANADGWMPSFNASIDRIANDARGAMTSGSLRVALGGSSASVVATVAAVQCLAVKGGSSYDVAAKVLVPNGQGVEGGLDLWYYPSADCSGTAAGTLLQAQNSGGNK